MISSPKYVDHPYVTMFPLMSGKPFDDLVEDIRKNGQRVPCVRYKTRTIDGRNRICACAQLGIVPTFSEWEPADPNGDIETQIVEFIVSMNLHRRQLTASQRAAVAVGYYDKTKSRFGGEARWANKGPADIRAGKLFNVSADYVRRASKIKRRRKDLFAEIVSGQRSIESAVSEERRTRTSESGGLHKGARRGHLLMVWGVMLSRDREDFPEFEAVWQAMAAVVDSRSVRQVACRQYEDRRRDEDGPQSDRERESMLDIMAERVAAGLPAKECYAN
jgi:hypothetical protein